MAAPILGIEPIAQADSALAVAQDVGILGRARPPEQPVGALGRASYTSRDQMLPTSLKAPIRDRRSYLVASSNSVRETSMRGRAMYIQKPQGNGRRQLAVRIEDDYSALS